MLWVAGKVLVLLGLCWGVCAARADEPAQKQGMRLLVASSLAPLLEQVQNDMTKAAQAPIQIVSGSSAALARQVRQGLVAHFFVSAQESWVSDLEARGFTSLVMPWFSDSLAFVVPRKKPARWKSLHQALKHQFRLALGEPETVPVGTYALSLLKERGLSLHRERHQKVFAKSAAGVLRLVELGAVDGALLYSSFAGQSSQVRVVERFDGKRDPKVMYHIAQLEAPQWSEAQSRLWAYFKGPAFQALVRERGLQPNSGAQGIR